MTACAQACMAVSKDPQTGSPPNTHSPALWSLLPLLPSPLLMKQ